MGKSCSKTTAPVASKLTIHDPSAVPIVWPRRLPRPEPTRTTPPAGVTASCQISPAKASSLSTSPTSLTCATTLVNGSFMSGWVGSAV
ncbi:MAG TPA: hypothetical protein VGM56_24755 [Byssovorax sp.]